MPVLPPDPVAGPAATATVDTMQVPALGTAIIAGPAAGKPASDAPAQAAPAASAAPPADPQTLQKALKVAADALREISTDLEFSMDPSTGKTVVRVIDSGTGQVIRQFPSEEMLAIARAIDRFKGFLLREQA